jgi:hypothetical protein
MVPTAASPSTAMVTVLSSTPNTTPRQSSLPGAALATFSGTVEHGIGKHIQLKSHAILDPGTVAQAQSIQIYHHRPGAKNPGAVFLQPGSISLKRWHIVKDYSYSWPLGFPRLEAVRNNIIAHTIKSIERLGLSRVRLFISMPHKSSAWYRITMIMNAWLSTFGIYERNCNLFPASMEACSHIQRGISNI